MPKLFMLLAAIFIYSSCADSALDSVDERPELSSEDYLKSYVKNPIIFQVAKIVEGSETVNGYVFTKSGELKSFIMKFDEFDREFKSVDISYLNKLLSNSSALIHQLGFDELAQAYKNNLLSGRTEVTKHGTKENENKSIVFSSYILKTEYTTWTDANNHCPVHHNPFAETDEYLSVVLKSEGRSLMDNYGGFVTELVSYLKSELSKVPQAAASGF